MKLKDEDIREIARLVDEGYGSTYISTKYNYSRGSMQRIIARYRKHGLEGILNKNPKVFTIEDKINIINRNYAGESLNSLSIELNIRPCIILQWVKKYEQLGYNGLIDNRGKPGVSKMRSPKKNQTQEQQVSTTEAMAPVTYAEREELNRLRKENYQLKLELACTKKSRP